MSMFLDRLYQEILEMTETVGNVLDTHTNEHLDVLDVKALAVIQSELSEQIDALKSARSALITVFDNIRNNKLPALMEDEGLEKFSLTGVGTVYTQDDAYVSIHSDKKSDAHEWLSDSGHGECIKPNVNANSLKALIKSLIKKGEDIPEDIFKITPYTQTRIRSK